MSAPRFYAPHLTQFAALPFSRGTLDGAEARHAISVLRLGVDDRVNLFDGRGSEVVARIAALSRQQLQFEVIDRCSIDRELPHRFTLAMALPKGDRQKVLVDAATELGVTQLVPLRLQRGVAQPNDSALERLRRQVIEASKQCGRNYLMSIADPFTLPDLVQNCGSDSPSQSPGLRLVAHPYDIGVARTPLAQQLNDRPCSTTLVIGPEGGLTDEEVASLAQHGWHVVDLGRTILRIEIAAIAAVAQIAAWLGNDPSSETTRCV